MCSGLSLGWLIWVSDGFALPDRTAGLPGQLGDVSFLGDVALLGQLLDDGGLLGSLEVGLLVLGDDLGHQSGDEDDEGGRRRWDGALVALGDWSQPWHW